MHMEVLHISCNMCTHDLPDMYALSLRACGPRALGIHIRQIPHAHVTTITYIYIYIVVDGDGVSSSSCAATSGVL